LVWWLLLCGGLFGLFVSVSCGLLVLLGFFVGGGVGGGGGGVLCM